MTRSKGANWIKQLTYYGWPLLVLPTLLLVLGSFSNQAVIAANHGVMPVSYPPCFAEGAVPGMALDDIHACIAPSSHLKVLADLWMNSQGSYESFGDGLIDLGEWARTWAYYVWFVLFAYCHVSKRDYWIEDDEC